MTLYRLYRIEPCANETYSTAERCQSFKGNPSWIIDKWARCVGCQFDGTREGRTEVVVEPDDASCGDDTITVYLEVSDE